MKGRISLGDFITQVKDELVAAQDKTGDPFLALDNIELEVSFALETSGGAKGKLVVVELGGEAKASQTHKVTLKLSPLPVLPKKQIAEAPQGGGAGGVLREGMPGYSKPVYGPAD